MVLCLGVDGKECHKAIEDVEEGDLVWAYDEETGESDWKPVVRLFRNKTEEWYHIHVAGEEIVCTGGHPFYVVDKGFVRARDLTVQDRLLLADKTEVSIEEISVEKLSDAETIYNFEVQDFHTYFVTESNVLVHNKCGFGEFADNPKSLWGKSADEVADALGDGWIKDTYGSNGKGWKFTKGDKMVAYHAGGGRHVGSYYKITSSTLGKIKVIGLDYLHLPGEKATIINFFGG